MVVVMVAVMVVVMVGLTCGRGIPVDPRVPVGSTEARFHALCRSKWLKMTENEPKMTQNDQNAYKMRVKTPHGHKMGVPGKPNLP